MEELLRVHPDDSRSVRSRLSRLRNVLPFCRLKTAADVYRLEANFDYGFVLRDKQNPEKYLPGVGLESAQTLNLRLLELGFPPIPLIKPVCDWHGRRIADENLTFKRWPPCR